MHRCQHCPNSAILHITEILGAGQFAEVHLCAYHAAEYALEDATNPTAVATAHMSQHGCPDIPP